MSAVPGPAVRWTAPTKQQVQSKTSHRNQSQNQSQSRPQDPGSQHRNLGHPSRFCELSDLDKLPCECRLCPGQPSDGQRRLNSKFNPRPHIEIKVKIKVKVDPKTQVPNTGTWGTLR